MWINACNERFVLKINVRKVWVKISLKTSYIKSQIFSYHYHYIYCDCRNIDFFSDSIETGVKRRKIPHPFEFNPPIIVSKVSERNHEEEWKIFWHPIKKNLSKYIRHISHIKYLFRVFVFGFKCRTSIQVWKMSYSLVTRWKI